MPSRRLLLVGLIAFAAAIAGVFVGRLVADAPRASETELHALLHGQLDLTPEQERKLERIEDDLADRRQAIELEMRAANVRLSQAIEDEPGYGKTFNDCVATRTEVKGRFKKEKVGQTKCTEQIVHEEYDQ